MNARRTTARLRLCSGVFGAGLLFGLGLAIAGMTRPEKVLGFLDLGGDWDPSLLLVLGAALGVSSVGFPAILRRPRPIWTASFDLPLRRQIDYPLAVGAVLFGAGWGISGYCPGPAVALLAALPGSAREAGLFLPALLIGLWGWRWIARRWSVD